MNDSISMFIDNELSLDEKLDFIVKINSDNQFFNESVSLLEQERLLRSDVVSVVPQVSFKRTRRFSDIPYFNPFMRIASACIATAVFVFFILSFQLKNDNTVSKRFVLYNPEAVSVQISGSFTDWNNIPMKMAGPSGYWEIELDVVKGEHKYLYIIGDDKRIADPTILMREKDDFGSENSVLLVET